MIWGHGKTGYKDLENRKDLESSLIDERSTAVGAKLSSRSVRPPAGGVTQIVSPGHPRGTGIMGDSPLFSILQKPACASGSTGSPCRFVFPMTKCFNNPGSSPGYRMRPELQWAVRNKEWERDIFINAERGQAKPSKTSVGGRAG